jgi:hypothetical protein
VNGAVTVTDGEDDDERERESAVSYRSWKMYVECRGRRRRESFVTMFFLIKIKKQILFSKF